DLSVVRKNTVSDGLSANKAQTDTSALVHPRVPPGSVQRGNEVLMLHNGPLFLSSSSALLLLSGYPSATATHLPTSPPPRCSN
ncbi:hypothetical protein KUCAC02_019447, partial [Chaenocephalus aceratus]